MVGLTRGPVTLLAAAVAGLLIWIAAQLNNAHEGGYWGIVGLIAGAGLVMAISQILGGWTKWGWPRLSPGVFLIAFVPVAIATLWVIFAGEPHAGWFHNHVMAWTRDIHVSGLVTDLLKYIPVLAFGAGLVFGFSFDTTGPRVRQVERDRAIDRRRDVGPPDDRTAADEPLSADRTATRTTRTGDREPVASDGRAVNTDTTRTGNREPVVNDGRAVDDTEPTRTS